MKRRDLLSAGAAALAAPWYMPSLLPGPHEVLSGSSASTRPAVWWTPSPV